MPSRKRHSKWVEVTHLYCRLSRQELQFQHDEINPIQSGLQFLCVRGAGARALLAQGPIDLHGFPFWGSVRLFFFTLWFLKFLLDDCELIQCARCWNKN